MTCALLSGHEQFCFWAIFMIWRRLNNAPRRILRNMMVSQVWYRSKSDMNYLFRRRSNGMYALLIQLSTMVAICVLLMFISLSRPIIVTVLSILFIISQLYYLRIERDCRPVELYKRLPVSLHSYLQRLNRRLSLSLWAMILLPFIALMLWLSFI